MSYIRKDHYYKRAKDEGKPSRSAYKIEQLNKKFHLAKNGFNVLDLGCAPGGWLLELCSMVGKSGRVLGIDILPLKISIPSNAMFILGDILSMETIKKIQTELKKEVDLVVSDMAPNTSGVAFRDAYLSFELCTVALRVANKTLKDGGSFVAKIFMGNDVEEFKRMLKKRFKNVFQEIPPATRKGSKELYLIATGFKKGMSQDGEE